MGVLSVGGGVGVGVGVGCGWVGGRCDAGQGYNEPVSVLIVSPTPVTMT